MKEENVEKDEDLPDEDVAKLPSSRKKRGTKSKAEAGEGSNPNPSKGVRSPGLSGEIEAFFPSLQSSIWFEFFVVFSAVKRSSGTPCNRGPADKKLKLETPKIKTEPKTEPAPAAATESEVEEDAKRFADFTDKE